MTLLQSSKVFLREKGLEDASNDYRWRQDEELSRLDASFPLAVPYDVFLQSYIGELHNPDYGLRFAIVTREGKHIGNALCYGIDKEKEEAEIGIMIGERSYWNKGYGTEALLQLAAFAFKTLALRRLYLRTLWDNLRAQRCFQKCGFVPVKSVFEGGHHFVLMELLHQDWEKRASPP